MTSRFLFAAVILLASAATALAQESNISSGGKLFSRVSFVDSSTPASQLQVEQTSLVPVTAFGAPAAMVAPAASSTMAWKPIVYVGFNSGGGGGFAVGGGVEGMNLGNHENFGLNIDFLWSNAGGCPGCGDFGFSAHQISIAVAFIYWFKEMSSGWHPFAGGGIDFSRYSYSYDNNVFCPGCSASASNTGLQIQGGIEKDKIHLEARIQPNYGGAFLFLFGYKFGS